MPCNHFFSTLIADEAKERKKRKGGKRLGLFHLGGGEGEKKEPGKGGRI